MLFLMKKREYVDIGNGVYNPTTRPPKLSTKQDVQEKTFGPVQEVTVLAEPLPMNGHGNGRVFSPNGEIRFQGKVRPVIEA